MRLIGKWNKSKYGDKQVIENKNTNINIDTGDMSDEDLVKVIKG